ncbi:MAG: hypothetical protein LBR30_07700 [Clostridioides sp.]|jgi:hypothetical protein|nr:hypothetical protein [Clostridioides sp.]
MSSDDAFIKSSMIAFALMKNVDEVTMNFPFDKDSEAKVGSIELNKDGKTAYATCTRKDLLDAFKDIYGDNFKEIVKDEKSLDKFLKVDLMSQIEK